MNKYALTVENLTKVYSDFKNKKENRALNNLNFLEQGGSRDNYCSWCSRESFHFLGSLRRRSPWRYFRRLGRKTFASSLHG